jgi:hypothetical protein
MLKDYIALIGAVKVWSHFNYDLFLYI